MSDDGADRGPLDRLPWAGRSGLWHQYRALRVRGYSVTWVPPLVLLITIVLVDYWTGTEFRIIAWVVLVPGIAAALCRVWTTAAFTGLVLATYLFVEAVWPQRFSPRLSDFTLIAIGGVLATLACAVRVRGEEHALRMRDIQETVRRTVLREMPPGWGGLEHAEVYLPADTEARVGGDFYDIQPGLSGTRVLLGDVQGKGLGAVEAAAALLGTFREAGYHERDLAVVGERLGIRMMRHRGRVQELGREDDDRFATAVLLAFPDDDPGAVHVINFGHEPPLLVGPGGVRTLRPGGALPLGLAELEPPSTARPLTAHRVPLSPGETILLTTDGVTEARDTEGVFFPLETAVTQAITKDARCVEPARLVAVVREGVLRHCGGRLADDTTIFAVRRV
ncbi:PP2C family protein-serine/threonine phosphatase [Streptomyces sp. NPDC056716]|uniref:PP2C family protein-serine/threonine phosphatase n=1 Tax=unclassified Streptomyces TaxID=2593676 RepID=UPI00367C51FB